MQTAESGLGPRTRGIILIVVNISSRIWASTFPCIIWSSRSCGDVRSRGVQFGRERRRIVSIIGDGPMISRTWPVGSHLGQ